MSKASADNRVCLKGCYGTHRWPLCSQQQMMSQKSNELLLVNNVTTAAAAAALPACLPACLPSVPLTTLNFIDTAVEEKSVNTLTLTCEGELDMSRSNSGSSPVSTFLFPPPPFLYFP